MVMASKNLMRHVPRQRIMEMRPNIWTEFVTLAAECKAVNIGQGFPNIAAPDFVTNLLKNVCNHPEEVDYHQYTRGFGHPRLVKAISKLYTKTLKVDLNPDTNVLITVGGYLSLYYTFMGWLNDGDEVIVIEPAFDCYIPQILMADGVPLPVPLELSPNPKNSSDYRLNLQSVEEKISSRTKMLVLNNPHNPTGKLFTEDELSGLADIAKRHDLLVVSDEVYEWHIYPGKKMIRFASLPGMFERTITIGSAGKTFSITGWKTGWSIGPAHLLGPLKLLHQNCVFTCPTPLQEAIAQALELELELFSSNPDKSYLLTVMTSNLRGKRNRMAEMLRNAGMKPIIPESGYFMLADISDLANKVYVVDKNKEEALDFQFVRWLCKEHKLATIPSSAFYSDEYKAQNDHFIRVCFFKSNETLNEADAILQKLSSKSSERTFNK